jgi:hypothetical protein
MEGARVNWERNRMSFIVPPGRPRPVTNLEDHRATREIDEVWAEVLAAARLFGMLREAGLSVRFDPDEDGGPVRVRITDLDGNTVREISPATAVDPAALAREAFRPAV